VSDRITLAVRGAAGVIAAFEAHRGLVESETLATSSTAEGDPELAPGAASVSVARA